MGGDDSADWRHDARRGSMGTGSSTWAPRVHLALDRGRCQSFGRKRKALADLKLRHLFPRSLLAHAPPRSSFPGHLVRRVHSRSFIAPFHYTHYRYHLPFAVQRDVNELDPPRVKRRRGTFRPHPTHLPTPPPDLSLSTSLCEPRPRGSLSAEVALTLSAPSSLSWQFLH